MIENSMVIGDYYEGCTFGECEECGRELTEEDNDSADGCLCNGCEAAKSPCPCIFCGKPCDETCEVKYDA